MSKIRKLLSAAMVIVMPLVHPAFAQDMLDMVDLKSEAFTKTEMSRAEIEAALANLKEGETLDLTGKSLNGLDLSGMDLRRTVLQSARLMMVNLKGANLEGVNLDSVWSMNSDLTGAILKGASMFGT